MPTIKFCNHNSTQHSKDVISKLQSNGESVEIENCLDYCGECASGPFVVIDDELIKADTPEELYTKIKTYL